MSQDLRKYRLKRVDENDNEASEMSITATVGPTVDEYNSQTRGVQVTLRTEDGYAYARVSEQQIRDLIRVLETRINPLSPFEATGWRADELVIEPTGEIDGRVP